MSIKSNRVLASYYNRFIATGTDASKLSVKYTEATGGIINDWTDNGKYYRCHTFLSSGTFDVTQVGSDGTIEYLVVAGGGGGSQWGGGNGGGGGGAGGLKTNLSGHPMNPLAPYPITVHSYTVTVGGGGYSAQGVQGGGAPFQIGGGGNGGGC